MSLASININFLALKNVRSLAKKNVEPLLSKTIIGSTLQLYLLDTKDTHLGSIHTDKC